MLPKLIELVLRRWPESTVHKSVQDMTTAWSHQQIAALRNKPLLLDDFIERLGSCVILNQNVQVYFPSFRVTSISWYCIIYDVMIFKINK